MIFKYKEYLNIYSTYHADKDRMYFLRFFTIQQDCFLMHKLARGPYKIKSLVLGFLSMPRWGENVRKHVRRRLLKIIILSKWSK